MGPLDLVRFRRRALAAGWEALDLPAGGSLALALAPLLAGLPEGPIVSQDAPALAACAAGLARAGRPVLLAGRTPAALLRGAAFEAVLGLAVAEVAVVATGAVGWRDPDGSAGLVTGLPPVLAVLVEPPALVPDLGAGLARLRGRERLLPAMSLLGRAEGVRPGAAADPGADPAGQRRILLLRGA